MTRASAAFGLAALLFSFAAAAREATITVHAGKADSANYALARQFAEALALAGNGAFTLVVEESQGSVQNVMDSIRLDGDYIFTANSATIAQARRGDKPFEKNAHYDEIRSLFPVPAQTFHWIVRQDSGIKTMANLAGQPFIPGSKGSLGEWVTDEVLQVLGIDKSVQLIDADISGAGAALKDKQVGGFTATGSFPMAAVSELASVLPIRILSLPQPAILRMHAVEDSTAAVVIPRGTYPGIDYDVTTLSVPAGAYTTISMTNATAYAITKAFWSQRFDLAKKHPAWAAVIPSRLTTLGARLHPGALRYYSEAGIKVPANLR
jgi:TRAP transporter TAXI family solute receptor